MAEKTYSAKLIPIADDCKDGCQLVKLAEVLKSGGMTDPHFLAGQIRADIELLHGYRAALQKIVTLTDLSKSMSEVLRGLTMIKATAEEALK